MVRSATKRATAKPPGRSSAPAGDVSKRKRTARGGASTVAPVARGSVQIEQWALGRLKPYGRNSRTHSPDQVLKIIASIQRFGFTNPILVAEDGTIIAGHGRTLAATKLGMATVPVIVASGWTDDERRAYVIADNKLALDAGWDEDILKLELGELSGAGFDIGLTGFGEDDLNQLFGNIADDVKPPPVIKTSFQILVECSDEAQQLALLEELQGREVECRALIS